jgi:DNA modification methylase
MHLNGEPLVVLCGDVVERLGELESESVHCCVTSPPYWGLRDYGTAEWEGGEAECDHLKPFDAVSHATSGLKLAKNHAEAMSNVGHKHEPYRNDCGKCGAKRIDSQLGLEKTPEEYVARMVEIFREVRRVLRKDGTLWLNLGDSYAANGVSGLGVTEGHGLFRGGAKHDNRIREKSCPSGLKPKDLVGIPWRVAFALQADGWYLRSDIIWSKPNPMPESVTDRPTRAHEYLFLLTKSPRYFYDSEAIREPELNEGRSQAEIERQRKRREGNEFRKGTLVNDSCGTWRGNGNYIGGRNKRSVWTVATAPYPEAHFATYPPDLIKPCILAGTSAKGCCAKCGSPWNRIVEREIINQSSSPRYSGVSLRNDSEDGRTERATKTLGWQRTCDPIHCTGNDVTAPCTVLDPFAGSGTTGAVALELGRKAILIELNPTYCELIEQRCTTTMGLQLA